MLCLSELLLILHHRVMLLNIWRKAPSTLLSSTNMSSQSPRIDSRKKNIIPPTQRALLEPQPWLAVALSEFELVIFQQYVEHISVAPVCFCEPFSANHFHIWDTISRCKGHCPGDMLSNNNASDAPLVLLITHMNGLTWWNNLRNEQRYTMRKKKNVNSFELRFCQSWFMNALPEFSFASLLSSFWHKLYTRCIFLFVC